MKNLLLLMVVLLVGCTPEMMMMPNQPSDFEINQNYVQTNVQIYDEWGNVIPDFVPALQPFVNEGCNTAWDNLSAIVNEDGTLTYFVDLPDWTADTTDYDKDRFTFIYQAQNPWFGVYPEEEPYAQIAGSGWYPLPVDDYGSMTCIGLQEIRIWVLDELTGTWFMNSQVCWAGWLCNGQEDCNQGWSFDQIEYPTYESGYIHLSNTPISNL